MGSLVKSFRVKAPLKELVSYLSTSEDFSRVYRKTFEEKGIAVLIGEQFFLRTGSWAGITIIVKEESANSCSLDVIAFAGGAGIFNISWFSEESYIEKLVRFIKRRYPIEEL